MPKGRFGFINKAASRLPVDVDRRGGAQVRRGRAVREVMLARLLTGQGIDVLKLAKAASVAATATSSTFWLAPRPELCATQ